MTSSQKHTMEEKQKARRQARAKERQRKRLENRTKSKAEKTGQDTAKRLNIFDNGEKDPLQNNSSAFPQWSWDHVRPWVILRKDTAYDEHQMRQIAHHDIFVIEKMTGWKTYGSNEAGKEQVQSLFISFMP